MTFKASVLGALASVLAIGAASAADLPSRKGPPAYAPPPPAFTWDGWHIGVVGGYGGGTASYNNTQYVYVAGPGIVGAVAPGAVGVFNYQTTRGTNGWLVGYESGYTWQFANNFVLGYESEFSYADVRTDNDGWFGGMNSRLEWFGAERLRFGYAIGRFLPYITGGLSYGRVRAYGADFNGGLMLPTSTSTWQAGWTVGAGLEYAFLDNWSIKGEYLYSSMKGPSGNAIGLPGTLRIYDGRGFDTHMARLGLNYNIKSIGALIGIPGL